MIATGKDSYTSACVNYGAPETPIDIHMETNRMSRRAKQLHVLDKSGRERNQGAIEAASETETSRAPDRDITVQKEAEDERTVDLFMSHRNLLNAGMKTRSH